MNVIDRFLTYVKVDTMSDEHSETSPSSKKQLDLATRLVDELKALQVEDAHVDEYGIVYGWLPANTKKQIPAIGFIAHMDTSPDMSGKDVNPRIVKSYDGSDIMLNEKQNVVLSPKEFPALLERIGEDLIVTDGTTLLGADDKAGIAEIMSLVDTLQHQKIEHGLICIAFTPDEEVGRGTDHFDIKKFKADYAYTVDGGDVNSVDFENFNAASATITIHGKTIHPGAAKHKMVNSQLLAMQFHQLLPNFEDPACTEDREGFHHLTQIQGHCEETKMEYIIRNHDETIFARQKEDFIKATTFMNERYGKGSVECHMEDSYYNMRVILEKHMDIIENVKEAMLEVGLTPFYEAIRGGTDGARLTFDGLPCPNLGTGGFNYHGKYEYASISQMEKSVELLTKIIEISGR